MNRATPATNATGRTRAGRRSAYAASIAAGIALLCYHPARADSAVSRPTFHPSLAAASEAAATDQSLVLVIFSAEWCGPCKLLKKNSLTSTNFTESGGALRVVEVDIDADAKTAQAFDVNAVPTLVLLTADGKIVTRRTGYLDGSQLGAWLESGRERANRGQWDGIAVGQQLDAFTKKAANAELSDEDLKQLIGRLSQADPAERNATSRLLLPQRERIVPLLIEAARDSYLGTRIAAVELLQQLAPGKITFDPWQSPEELAAAGATLRKWWADAGKLPASVTEVPTDPTTLGVIKAALLQLSGTDPARRTEAMSALVAHGPTALPAVRDAIKRAERSGDQRSLALLEDVRWTILVPEPLEQRVGNVRKVLAHGTSSERQAAAAQLGRGGREAVPALQELVNDGDALVVENSVRALSEISGPDSIPAMAALLSAGDANLRMTAAQALGKTKNKEAIPRLLAVVTDSNEVVACTALTAIEQLNSARSYSARQQQSPELTTALRGALGDPRWRVRAAAAEIVGKLEAKALTMALQELLEDEDGFVVKNALEALEKLGNSPEPERLDTLARRHSTLRRQVVKLLVRSGNETGAKVVEELYRAGETSERIAILQALGEKGTAGDGAERATWKPLLKDASASPDSQLRRAAAEALKTQPPKSVAEFVGNLLVDDDAETRAAAIGAMLTIINGDNVRSPQRLAFSTYASTAAKPKTNASNASAEQLRTWHEALLKNSELPPDPVTAAAIFVTGDTNKDLPLLSEMLGRANQESLQKFAESPALRAIAGRLPWPEGKPVMEALCSSPDSFVAMIEEVPSASPCAEFLFEPQRFLVAVERASGKELERTVLRLVGSTSTEWSLLSDHPRLAPVVATLLESTNAAWQAAALYALSRKSVATNLVRFERAVQHRNAWVRGIAVQGLAKLSTNRLELEARIGPLLADPEPFVARRAALALLEPEVRQPTGLDYELESFVFEKIRASNYSDSGNNEQRPLVVLQNQPPYLETVRQLMAKAKPEESTPFVLLLAQHGDFSGVDQMLDYLSKSKDSDFYWTHNLALTGIGLSKDTKYLPYLKRLVVEGDNTSELQQVLQALRGMTGTAARELRVEINRRIRSGLD